MKSELTKLENLIGQQVKTPNGTIAEIIALHIYLSEKGVASVKAHLTNIAGYYRLKDLQIIGGNND